MFIAEFFGTMTLIVLGDGVVANVLLNKSKGQNSGWIVITAGWMIAVMMGVFVSNSLGGPGSLNPAGVISGWIRPGADIGGDIAVIVAQFAGAIVGAVIVYLLYLPHWEVTSDAGLKLAVFSTGPAIRKPVMNLITEILATFMLILVAGAIFSTKIGIGDTKGLGPIAIGALIWGLGLSLGGPTGYALNPARDLGPRIAHAFLPIPGKGSSDWEYAWVPVVGPIIGALLAQVVRMAIGL
jgi:glycerol uptake facilitator protein